MNRHGPTRSTQPQRDSSIGERSTNAALLDPTQFGWTAAGGVADLLHPQLRAARENKYRDQKALQKSRKRDRNGLFSSSTEPSRTHSKEHFRADDDGDRSSLSRRVVEHTKTDDLIHISNGACDPLESSIHDRSIDVFGAASVGSSAGVSTLPNGNSNIYGATIPQGTKVELRTSVSIVSAAAVKTESNLGTNTELNRLAALQQDGTLMNIFAYHQGREGSVRSESLNCTEGAESADRVGEPKFMVARVAIQFPLDDDESPGRDGAQYYRDAISWDLSDINTPNPVVFASCLAQEFGLSYVQTQDLVESIQTQLLSFVQDNFQQTDLTIVNMAQQSTTDVPRVPCLYDEATGFLQQGGHCCAYTPRTKLQPTSTAKIDCTRRPSGANAATLPTKPGRKRGSITRSIVENEFHNQVRIRLRAASMAEIRDNTCNTMQTRKNHVCHLCRDKQPLSSIFACGISNHAFCERHLVSISGLRDESESLLLDYCPICSLSCSCRRCAEKLDSIAIDFKRECKRQEASPESAIFIDFLNRCRKIEPVKNKKPENEGDMRKKILSKHLDALSKLPKISISDFPKESSHVDARFEDAYRATFTAKGPRYQEADTTPSISNAEGSLSCHELVPIKDGSVDFCAADNAPSLACHEPVPIEDGSVDFCIVCLEVGNLLCCDFCPRAFHSHCAASGIRCDTSETNKDLPWMCPSCRREKDDSLEDKVDGKTSLAKLRGIFTDCGSSEEDRGHITVLSMVHEMIHFLMNYDFGYMFREPVDCRRAPSYKAIVKNPIDLGTISENVLNVSKMTCPYKTTPLKDLPVKVLQDVELVWHNCFIFNREGSAVYRMAEVQKRRAMSIRNSSFECLLCDQEKRRLLDYETALSKEREEFRRIQQTVISKIPLQSSSSTRFHHKGRPVAALDEDNGKIAKIYSSLLSASKAINKIFELHKQSSESWAISIDTFSKLRRLVMKSQTHPNVLLFGFRWLFLDDLQNGTVVCAVGRRKNTPVENDSNTFLVDAQCIEMVVDGASFFFNSIDEALSCPTLSDDISDLRQKMNALVPGDNFVHHNSCMWRRKKYDFQWNSTGESLESSTGDLSRLPDVEFVKVDRTCGETVLVGFPNVKAAYQDWCQTIDAAVAPVTGTKTLDGFVQYYLDEECNVDGIFWRRASKSTTSDSCGIKPSLSVESHAGAVPAPIQDMIVDRGHEANSWNEKAGDEPMTLPNCPNVSALDKDIDKKRESTPPCAIDKPEPLTTGAPEASRNATHGYTENLPGTKVFDVETVSSPKKSDPKSKGVTSNGTGTVWSGLSENCQLPLVLLCPGRDDEMDSLLGQKR